MDAIQSKPCNLAEAAARLCSPTAAGGSRRGSAAPPALQAAISTETGRENRCCPTRADEIKRNRHHPHEQGFASEKPHERVGRASPHLSVRTSPKSTSLPPRPTTRTHPRPSPCSTAPAWPAERKGRGRSTGSGVRRHGGAGAGRGEWHWRVVPPRGRAVFHGPACPAPSLWSRRFARRSVSGQFSS